MAEMYKKEKIWNIIGIVAGICIILLGLYLFSQDADGHDTSWTDSASFGADFYTYQYKATRAAASNAAATAYYVRDFAEQIFLLSGIACLIVGVLVVIDYSRKLVLCTAAIEQSLRQEQQQKTLQEQTQVEELQADPPAEELPDL